MEIDIGAPSRLYRPDIDGIRAIAILSVVLYHAGVPQVPGGFTGVDIFFVISGYLIGGHIYSDLLTGSFSYLNFYRLRAKRILPAFYAMLAMTIMAALVLLSPFEAWEFSKSAIAATVSASNIYFWRHTNYFDAQNAFNPLLMTWSLGIEEQFYAVIPVLLVLLARVRRSMILPAVLTICVLSFVLSWRELGSHPFAVFYLSPMRAWELGLGVALAIVELGRKRSLVPGALLEWMSLTGLLLMLAPMALLTAASPFPGAAALPSVLGTALIIATPTSWINRRLLSLSPLVFMGKVSYSWYLWHWPILSFLRIISGGRLPTGIVALAVTASLGLAIASYFFVEQPFRRSIRAPAPLLLRYALVGLAFLTVCGVIWRSQGIPQRYPQLVQIDDLRISQLFDPCRIDDGSDRPNLSPICYENSGVRPAVAVWGDSHATALAPGLRKIAHAAGYDFIQLSKSACRPIRDTALDRHSIFSNDAECIRFNRNVLSRLVNDPRIKVVIVADAWGHMFSPPSTVEGDVDAVANRHGTRNQDQSQIATMQFLERSIQSLLVKGKQVVVMEDVPQFDIDPLLNYRTSRIPIRHAFAQRLGVLNDSDEGFISPRSSLPDASATKFLQEMIVTLPGATLVDLRHEFCDHAGRCIYRKDDVLFYRDFQHLSRAGADYALRDFNIPPAESR